MQFDPLPPGDAPGRRPPTPQRSRPKKRGLALRLSRNQRLTLYWSVPILVVIGIGAVAGVGLAAVIRVPKVESVDELEPGVITRLFDRHQAEFATFARERRVMLAEGDVPPLLEQAILSAEDANFRQHGGIDIQGVARAVFKNLVQGRYAMGGSTITMQLARNLFLSPEKKWRRKIEEALLAVELEKRFSKQQIITLYCNLMFMGHGNYGMAAAARSYFDKEVAELTLTEAATLAGIPQRPSAYSPYRRPDLVVNRRNYVLRRMQEEGYISEDEYDAASQQPLEVVPDRVVEEAAPYFAEDVRKYLESRYGSRGLLEKGLQVHTTLDATIQESARAALRAGLSRLDHLRGYRGPIENLRIADVDSIALPSWNRLDLRPGVWNQGVVVSITPAAAKVKLGGEIYELTAAGVKWTGKRSPAQLLKPGDVAWFRFRAAESDNDPPLLVLEQEPELEGAVVVLESATGAVRAMVGGWDFARSKFNRVTQARRQVGSAFKPFVYGASLEMGYTPADTLYDAPVAFPGIPGEPPYSPRNYYRQYYGIATLRRAVEESFNVSMVKLMDMIGAQQVIDFARRCGIESELHPYPSLALGAVDLTPLEVAAAYAVFANQGLYVRPYLIESVSEPNGTLLEQHGLTAHKAIDPDIAFVITHTLEGVIDRGTAASAAKLEGALAGKTGTTDDNSDAWFAGFTPRYSILVWVGHDVKRSIGRNMTGATAALPIWKALVADGLEDGWISPTEEFIAPPGIVFQQIDYDTGLLAGPGSGRVIREAFVAGTEPAQPFTPRWTRIMGMPWYQQQAFYVPKAGERMPDGVADWDPIIQSWAADK